MGEDYKKLATEAKSGSFNTDALAIAQDLSNLIHTAQIAKTGHDAYKPAE
jgi:hypothetical protein